MDSSLFHSTFLHRHFIKSAHPPYGRKHTCSARRMLQTADLVTTVDIETPVLGTMFRPSPPFRLRRNTFVPFSPLNRSPGSSSAARFTTTTASSADPLPVTVASPLRLGYAGAVTTPRHRRPFTGQDRPLSLPTHLLCHAGLRKGYRASAYRVASPSRHSLPEVHTEFG